MRKGQPCLTSSGWALLWTALSTKVNLKLWRCWVIVARASHCDEHQFRAKMTVSILEPFFEISSLKIVVLANKNEKMALSLLHTFAFSCLSDSDICSPEIPKILGHALVSSVDIQHSRAFFYSLDANSAYTQWIKAFCRVTRYAMVRNIIGCEKWGLHRVTMRSELKSWELRGLVFRVAFGHLYESCWL